MLENVDGGGWMCFDLTKAKKKDGVDILCAMEPSGAEVRSEGFKVRRWAFAIASKSFPT